MRRRTTAERGRGGPRWPRRPAGRPEMHRASGTGARPEEIARRNRATGAQAHWRRARRLGESVALRRVRPGCVRPSPAAHPDPPAGRRGEGRRAVRCGDGRLVVRLRVMTTRRLRTSGFPYPQRNGATGGATTTLMPFTRYRCIDFGLSASLKRPNWPSPDPCFLSNQGVA